jgi:uncharacterized protein YaiL (DUF2058 family)
MSNSLREKLLGLGFKAPEPEPPKPRPERSADGGRRDGRPPQAGKPGEPARTPYAGKPENRRGGRPPQAGKPGEPARAPYAGKPENRRDGRPPQAGKPGEPTPARAPYAGKPENRRGGRPPQAGKPAGARPARTREDIDLAKAYAIRAQKEKDERIEAERLRQEEARVRREAKAKLAELLKDKGLNDPAADIARHFPYGGKIKRIHVTEAQLKALNAGELGVVQLDGRYLLVTAAMLAEAEAVFAPAVALRVDPNAAPGDDPYADPQYQVPDDLVW